MKVFCSPCIANRALFGQHQQVEQQGNSKLFSASRFGLRDCKRDLLSIRFLVSPVCKHGCLQEQRKVTSAGARRFVLILSLDRGSDFGFAAGQHNSTAARWRDGVAIA